MEPTAYCDIISKSITAICAIIAAYKVLHEMSENRKQRARELRWRQSNAARELINNMLASTYVQAAFTMLDWEDREFEIDTEETVSIDYKDIRKALRIENLTFKPKEVYIRDCMDAFLFHVEMAEQAIENKLIEQRDIMFPFYYYYKTIVKNDLKGPLDAFIKAYDYTNASQFMKRMAAVPI